MVRAYNVSIIKNIVQECDVVLIRPQIGHMEKEIKSQFPNNLVLLLSMLEFGMMDDDALLERILKETQSE